MARSIRVYTVITQLKIPMKLGCSQEIVNTKMFPIWESWEELKARKISALVGKRTSVTQWLEHLTRVQEFRGSNPSWGKNFSLNICCQKFSFWSSIPSTLTCLRATVNKGILLYQHVLVILGVRHSTYRDARGVAHSYFFSWEHGPTRSLEVDWLDARNICRRHCMDAVSLETPQENEFVKQRIARGNRITII